MALEIKAKAVAIGKKLRLDSHFAIERFGIAFAVITTLGLAVIGSSAASAYRSDQAHLSRTALYTEEFTTSKTDLQGNVDGVYTNSEGTKALVMMTFEDDAQISSDAGDYQAFLLGSAKSLGGDSLGTEPVATSGVTGSVHVFGSTGTVGVLLEADEPFEKQVLNLTVRANEELAYDETPDEVDSDDTEEAAEDATFAKYDQWRVYTNPGGSDAQEISALDSPTFDPARAYHQTVQKDAETEARAALDEQLLRMRTDLTRIESYSRDLRTTKVDGLFLRPPKVPSYVRGDRITGHSAAKAKNGRSTLELHTNEVADGGFALDWRSGNVYRGYLDALVPSGKSYAQFLADKQEESSEEDLLVSDMTWTLSDGSDLIEDYSSTDVAMQPLVSVMNNLAQAYQDYDSDKRKYQTELMLDLLSLDVELRDVESNSSKRTDEKTVAVLY